MIRRKGIVYTIIYYNIIPLLLFGIILYVTRDYIINYAISLVPEPFKTTYTEPISMFLKAALGVIWLMIFIISTRDKTYLYKTGRHFQKDHNRFRRSYYDLTEYFENAEPHKMDLSEFKKEKWYSYPGIIFGTDKGRLIAIPSDSECNITIFGPPGSGKTRGIAIPNAMMFDGSVLAVDIKGDIYNYVSQHSNRRILRFCPDEPNALMISCRFDPFENILTMSDTDKKLYIESIATVLIKEEGEGADNYFTSRARKIFQGVTYLLMDENPLISFPEVIHSILRGNIFDFVNKAIDGTCEPAKEYLASFYGNSEKNVSGAYDALTTALVKFTNPTLDVLLSRSNLVKNNSDVPALSIDYLEKGYDIYLQISQEHLEAYAPLFTLIIQSLSTAFTKRPDSSTGVKNRPILMLLDEFPQLTFSQTLINTNLSTLRSKSIIIMMIQQNLSQLEYKYKPAGTRSIIGNCNYQLVLGSNDINSSKVFSDTFGYKKILKLSNSETKSQNNSSGWSVQEATEKVFPPEYFGDLQTRDSIILYCGGKYTECNKINCYKDNPNIITKETYTQNNIAISEEETDTELNEYKAIIDKLKQYNEKMEEKLNDARNSYYKSNREARIEIETLKKDNSLLQQENSKLKDGLKAKDNILPKEPPEEPSEPKPPSGNIGHIPHGDVSEMIAAALDEYKTDKESW